MEQLTRGGQLELKKRCQIPVGGFCWGAGGRKDFDDLLNVLADVALFEVVVLFFLGAKTSHALFL
jgi:hypothetical protein